MKEKGKLLYKKRLRDMYELGFEPVIKITAVLGLGIAVYPIADGSIEMETITTAVIIGLATFLVFTYALGSMWWAYNATGFRTYDKRKFEEAERDSEDPWKNAELWDRPWWDFRSDQDVENEYFAKHAPSPLNFLLAMMVGPALCIFVFGYNLIMYLITSLLEKKK